MVVGYARISTADQSTAAQLPELKKAGCRKIYQETMSGRTMDRPELEKGLERLEEGDTLSSLEAGPARALTPRFAGDRQQA